MPTNRNPSDVLKVGDVSRLTGLSPSSVYRATAAGYLPHFRVGPSIRFRESTILAFIEAQEARASRR